MPSLSPEDFKRAVEDYAKKTVPKIARDAQTVVARMLYESIAETTPVLTSRARWNWNISFNAPNYEVTDETAGLTETGTPITAKERSKVQSVLRNNQFGEGEVLDDIYITNALPYIFFLDNGTSAKAPAGIVDVAIQRTLENTGRLASEIKKKVGKV